MREPLEWQLSWRAYDWVLKSTNLQGRLENMDLNSALRSQASSIQTRSMLSSDSFRHDEHETLERRGSYGTEGI